MPSSACKKCARSEEHTSELQSHDNLVCRLLLEKNKENSRRVLVQMDGLVEIGVRGACVPEPTPRPHCVCLSCRATVLIYFVLSFFFFLKTAPPPNFPPFPPPPLLPS